MVREGSRGTATALVLVGIVSVQVGAAFATTLFDELGPGGTVFLRIAFAAVLLLVIWRPPLRLGEGVARRDVVLLGLVLAGMNLSFYVALDRIPLGIAVTLEFIGPLGVAIAGSRRRLDLLWVGLAAAGILLLSPVPGSDLDGLGVVMALVAGCFWGAYILLTARVGRALPGGGGLAIAMTIAAVAVIPVGLADGGDALLDAELLAIGSGGGGAELGASVLGGAGGAAAAAREHLRGPDEPRAGRGRDRRIRGARPGPGRARGRGDRTGAGGEPGRATRGRHPQGRRGVSEAEPGGRSGAPPLLRRLICGARTRGTR